MPSPSNNPRLQNVTEATTIRNATQISVYAVTGTTDVTANGTLTLPEGVGVQLSGEDIIMASVTITPSEGATAIVASFS